MFNTYAATELAAAPLTSPLWVGPILCEVISSTLIADNRWRYRLTECGIDYDDGLKVDGAAGAFDTETALAFNGCEAPNTSLVASGITVADLPAGFALAAVPNGELVLAWFRYDAKIVATVSESVLVGIFNRPGEFEGTCA